MPSKYAHLASLIVLAAIVVFSNLQSETGTLYGNTLSAIPSVVRPSTPSCRVTLVFNQKFDSATGQYVGTFNPPMDCPAPWAKVVLDWRGQIASSQIDRLASLWIGGTEVFRGSTPFATWAGATWHVDKDLTEYTPVFEKTQSFSLSMPNPQNWVNPGAIILDVSLTFYEASSTYAGPPHPDMVVPMSQDKVGSWSTLADKNKNLTVTLSFPTNIVNATLEVYATAHDCDEYWYATLLTGCQGATPFREIMIFVDGQFSGVQWPFPIVYTGGCDPGLWRPIPSINSLDIPPYTVNLSPIASKLSNGSKHTVLIQVANNEGYWRVDANLLLYLDHQQLVITGATTYDTLQAQPTSRNGQTVNGLSFVNMSNDSRSFTVSGYTDGSGGRVETTVREEMSFLNTQALNLLTLAGHVTQSATVTTITTLTSHDENMTETGVQTYTINADCQFMLPQLLPDSYYVTNNQTRTIAVNEFTTFHSYRSDTIQAQSRRNFYNLITDDKTSERFVTDSTESCYFSTVRAGLPCVTSLDQSRPNIVPIGIALAVGLILLVSPLMSISNVDKTALLNWSLPYFGLVLTIVGGDLALIKYSVVSPFGVGLLTLIWATLPELTLTILGTQLFVVGFRRRRNRGR